MRMHAPGAGPPYPLKNSPATNPARRAGANAAATAGEPEVRQGAGGPPRQVAVAAQEAGQEPAQVAHLSVLARYG